MVAPKKSKLKLQMMENITLNSVMRRSIWMKKILAMALTICMMLSMVACGKIENVSDENTETDKSSSVQLDADSTNSLEELGVKASKGDDSYFTPSTSDYIYLVGDDGSEDIQHTLLISFDNNGKAVQFVHKVYDKASGGDYSGENYIQEEDAWYKNLTSEEIGYALSDSRWSDKYSVLYDISKGEAYYEGLNCSKYHVSQKLTENQTKIENIHTINDFQYMSAMPLATEDYRITEKSDRTEVEEKIQDWDLMIRDMDSEYNMATVPVRMYNAFSYKTIYVSCFDTNGKMVESAEAYVFRVVKWWKGSVSPKITGKKAVKKMICPSCGNTMKLDDKTAVWKCDKCNYSISQKALNDGEVFWFCDKCEAFMNTQKSFKTESGHWTCLKCGFDNDVTDTKIDK